MSMRARLLSPKPAAAPSAPTPSGSGGCGVAAPAEDLAVEIDMEYQQAF